MAEPLEHSSEHFQFVADTHTSSKEELTIIAERAENLYQSLQEIIRIDFPIDTLIVVYLNGNITSQAPYVDGNGAIQLWRYSEVEGGYLSMLPHELVHAVGFDTAEKMGALEWKSLGFYNEGWAEYAAHLISPDKTGFPFYGFDRNIVAGYWISKEGPILQEYRDAHNELNLTCSLQSYPLRASWFEYVDETYGRNAILEIMYGGREMTPQVVEEVLGNPLSEIDAAWQKWITNKYRANPNADSLAKSYVERIAGYSPCD